MKENIEKSRQMIKMYKIYKNEFTGDEYTYSERTNKVYETPLKELADKKIRDLERSSRSELVRYYKKTELIGLGVKNIYNITDINYYSNLQDALKYLMIEDKTYPYFVRHNLKKNEIVKKDKHKNVNEWVIFEKGNLEIILELKNQIIDTTDLKEWCSIYIPKNTFHEVRTLSNLEYYVLKDKKT